MVNSFVRHSFIFVVVIRVSSDAFNTIGVVDLEAIGVLCVIIGTVASRVMHGTMRRHSCLRASGLTLMLFVSIRCIRYFSSGLGDFTLKLFRAQRGVQVIGVQYGYL